MAGREVCHFLYDLEQRFSHKNSAKRRRGTDSEAEIQIQIKEKNYKDHRNLYYNIPIVRCRFKSVERKEDEHAGDHEAYC